MNFQRFIQIISKRTGRFLCIARNFITFARTLQLCNSLLYTSIFCLCARQITKCTCVVYENVLLAQKNDCSEHVKYSLKQSIEKFASSFQRFALLRWNVRHVYTIYVRDKAGSWHKPRIYLGFIWIILGLSKFCTLSVTCT